MVRRHGVRLISRISTTEFSVYVRYPLWRNQPPGCLRTVLQQEVTSFRYHKHNRSTRLRSFTRHKSWLQRVRLNYNNCICDFCLEHLLSDLITIGQSSTAYVSLVKTRNEQSQVLAFIWSIVMQLRPIFISESRSYWK